MSAVNDGGRVWIDRHVVDSFPGGSMFVFDTELRYVVIGGPAMAGAGFTPAGTQGKTIWEVFGEVEGNKREPYYRRALAGERLHYDIDYGPRTHEMRLGPVIDEAGNVIAGVGYSQDVTEQRGFERALQEAQAERAHQAELLSRSNEDLRRFAYIASHDLQAPLRTIGGLTEVLMQSIGRENMTESQLEMAAQITSGAATLQQLIRGLLAFDKIERVSTVQGVDLATSIDAAIGLLSADITANAATVVNTATGIVLAEPTQLKQVFLNLIQNSIAHHDRRDAPEIRISSRQLEQEQTQVLVKDNGPGIDPQLRNSVFELFRKGRSSEGAGMGLAIAKRIIEASGGTITIADDDSRGTTFIVTLRSA